MADHDNVIKFPESKNLNKTTSCLQVLDDRTYKNRKTCNHTPNTFVIDAKAGTVECGRCKQVLDPIWVLQELSNSESRWHSFHKRFVEECKTLDKRRRTKCEHCKKMTRIRQS